MEVYSPAELIFDRSYEDWIIKWWNHDFNYVAPVYLIVADYGDGDTPLVPEFTKDIQALLLSPINFIAIDDGTGYAAMRQRAIKEIDIVDTKQIKVQFDGEEIGHLASRVYTKLFQTVNGFAISDGYWIFLKGPFKKGPHTLSTYGTCKSGQIQLRRSIDLLVV